MRKLLATTVAVLALSSTASRNEPAITYLYGLARAEDGYKELEKQNRAIYVISASWCGPCKILEQHLETLANRTRKIYIAKIDPPERPRPLVQSITKKNEEAAFPDPDFPIPAAIIVNGKDHSYTQGYDATSSRREDRILRFKLSEPQGVRIGDLF